METGQSLKREGSIDSSILDKVRIIGKDEIEVQEIVIPPGKRVLPQNLLPQLHQKTHFKAAAEYALGQATTTRSMHDTEGDIERTIRDGVNRLEREMQKK